NIVEEVDKCSEFFPPHVDEITLAGLTAVPSTVVKPPRIDQSPVNFECRVHSIIELPEAIHTLIIGRVVRIHLAESILLPNNRINHAALGAVGRMAGNSYCRTSEIFSLSHDGYANLAGAAN